MRQCMKPAEPSKNTPQQGFLKLSAPVQKGVFVAIAALTLTPWISAPIALLLGIVVSNFIGHPFSAAASKFTKYLLQASVVGLGFGINAQSALQAGSQGLLFTVATIFGTLLLGYLVGKMLKVDDKTSQLVSVGTAICGGSAIAAVSPIIQAEQKQISVSLGIVFILNSVALFVFPVIGHLLDLSQAQFGLWSAIAIHDTSSVVGAASEYGPEALKIATTVKLARALWIIPVSFGMAFLYKNSAGKVTIPYFIGWFVVAMLLNSYLTPVQTISPYLVSLAKAGLKLTLFLIGASLSIKMLQSVGPRAMVQGLVLWLVISLVSLWVIMAVA